MKYVKCLSILGLLLTVSFTSAAQKMSKLHLKIDQLTSDVEAKVIEWRHDIHQYPELSNREFKTAEKIATHLESLGIEIQTKVAHTGVVGILKGGKPGPVIALRADMDALPVVERVDIPFKSVQKSTYNGLEVGVMHACGHDTHVAILMGVAEVLSNVKSDLKGTIKFIFQPAEEGAPLGEEGGAELMVKEGVLLNPDVDVIFGLHINSKLEVGTISYKPGGTLASANSFSIKVTGKQTHGAYPWQGIDPIVAAAQIINNTQTIVSRSLPLNQEGAVVTFGSIHGGVRSNIIPEELTMEGTIRALDYDMQKTIFERFETIVTNTGESNGLKAELTIHKGYPITFNDPDLTALMEPTLQRVAGSDKAIVTKAVFGAEDFSFFQQKVPGLFIRLGGMPKGMKPEDAAPHHTPDFFIDNSGLLLGVKAMTNLVIDYANAK
ncbi:MAG: amidohydrolase [Cyclobacteriaceae bacterium]